jgi:hypothetical protein
MRYFPTSACRLCRHAVELTCWGLLLVMCCRHYAPMAHYLARLGVMACVVQVRPAAATAAAAAAAAAAMNAVLAQHHTRSRWHARQQQPTAKLQCTLCVVPLVLSLRVSKLFDCAMADMPAPFYVSFIMCMLADVVAAAVCTAGGTRCTQVAMYCRCTCLC